jgi:arylsulfatase A-like enzyme
LRWIEGDRDRPFFAFLNYFDVHAPYIPPQPYRGQFSEEEEPGGRISTDWDMDHIYVPLTPEQLQGEIDAYDGAIAYVDAEIARLLGELQARELAQDTLVIVTSDHGESFGEHGLLEHHNSLYREVIHVPLIFWWPGHVPEGARIATPVTNAALPATLLDLLGESDQTTFPGPSLAQLWQEPSPNPDWPDPLAEVGQVDWVPAQHLPRDGAMKAVISGQSHYVTHEQRGEELYDWQSDPEELNDLSQVPEYQPVVDQFRAYLETLVPGLVAWSR